MILDEIDNGNYFLHPEAVAVVDENTAYFAAADFNGLFKLDLTTGNSRYIGLFPQEDILKNRLYFSAVSCGNKVIFAPNTANNIAVFDVETKKIDVIPFDKISLTKASMEYKFGDVVAYKNYVFFIGALVPYVLKLDIKTYKLDYYPIKSNERLMFRKQVAVDGNTFYASSVCSGNILEFNMDTCKMVIHKLPLEEFCGSWGICMDEKKYIWLFPSHKDYPIVRWDKNKNQVFTIKSFPPELKVTDALLFHYEFYRDGYVYAMPSFTNMVLKVNTDTLKLETEEGFLLNFDDRIGYYFNSDKDIYLIRKTASENDYSQNENNYFKYNKDTHKTEKLEIKFNENIGGFKRDYLFNRAPTLMASNELYNFNLKDFCKYIPKYDETDNEKYTNLHTETVGKKIYDMTAK